MLPAMPCRVHNLTQEGRRTLAGLFPCHARQRACCRSSDMRCARADEAGAQARHGGPRICSEEQRQHPSVPLAPVSPGDHQLQWQ